MSILTRKAINMLTARRGGSNVYPQSMFRAKIRKKKYTYSTAIFQFLQLQKKICILNGSVFVMQGRRFLDGFQKDAREPGLDN